MYVRTGLQETSSLSFEFENAKECDLFAEFLRMLFGIQVGRSLPVFLSLSPLPGREVKLFGCQSGATRLTYGSYRQRLSLCLHVYVGHKPVSCCICSKVQDVCPNSRGVFADSQARELHVHRTYVLASVIRRIDDKTFLIPNYRNTWGGGDGQVQRGSGYGTV